MDVGEAIWIEKDEERRSEKSRKSGPEEGEKLTRDLHVYVVLVFASFLRIDYSNGFPDRDGRNLVHSN